MQSGVLSVNEGLVLITGLDAKIRVPPENDRSYYDVTHHSTLPSHGSPDIVGVSTVNQTTEKEPSKTTEKEPSNPPRMALASAAHRVNPQTTAPQKVLQIKVPVLPGLKERAELREIMKVDRLNRLNKKKEEEQAKKVAEAAAEVAALELALVARTKKRTQDRRLEQVSDVIVAGLVTS